MKISGLIWLEDIIDKLFVKHEVEENEVKEVLASRPLFRFVEKGHRKEDKCICSPWTNRIRTLLDCLFCLQKRQKGSYFIGKKYVKSGKEALYAKVRLLYQKPLPIKKQPNFGASMTWLIFGMRLNRLNLMSK